MSNRDNIINLLERIAGIATSVQGKLIYVLAVGLLASSYLAWSWYSSDSALWWNVIKCTVVLLPALLWLFIWSVLAQLQEAPGLAAKLLDDDQGVFSNTQRLSLREPNGLSGIFSTVRAFRKEGGLGIVFDTIGGLGVLANPIFAIISLISLGALFLLSFVAVLLLIF